MKALILAAAMTVAATAQAWTANYGPGAYKKSVMVCERNHSGGNVNCGSRTYKFYAPRMETVEVKNKSGNVIDTYQRLTTGNYAAIIFDNAAEEAAFNHRSRNDNNVPRGNDCRSCKK